MSGLRGPNPAPMQRAVNTALYSVLIGIAVLALKYAAFVLTGSVALYSDALESIINVVAAIAALIALRVSARPADANHPFGHTKAEYISAVIEGAMIVLAAISILGEAYRGLQHPKPLETPLLGLGVNLAASAINALWAAHLIQGARRWRSPALEADGRHLLTDVISSLGVLIGVGLSVLTGWTVLDPILAGLVALNVLWSGWGLMRDSVGGLMDAAAAPEVVARIRNLISEHASGALEAHDLRTRHAGHLTFIEFHLIVPGDMPVRVAHDICDRIEEVLQQEVEGSIITIHVEPEGKAKQHGVLVL